MWWPPALLLVGLRDFILVLLHVCNILLFVLILNRRRSTTIVFLGWMPTSLGGFAWLGPRQLVSVILILVIVLILIVVLVVLVVIIGFVVYNHVIFVVFIALIVAIAIGVLPLVYGNLFSYERSAM